MKILLTEEQISLIEATGGLDSFVNRITEKFFNDDLEGDYKEFQQLLDTSIEKSGCQKIDFGEFKINAGGVALRDNVVINDKLLNESMGTLLYVIFHEIAHQYQLRKYGEDIIYNIYLGNIDLTEGVPFIRKWETVADEYGIRKVREFISRGFVKNGDIPRAAYKDIQDWQIKYIMIQMINEVSKFPDKSKESVALNLYNFIVTKLS
jgi:hypothetical protein